MIMQWGENPECFKNQSISKVLLFSIAFKKATTLRCVHRSMWLRKKDMSCDIICQRKYRACPCSFVSFPGKIEPKELDMIANNGGTKNLLAIATPRNISNKTKDKLYNTALSENQNGKPCIINSSFSSDLQGSDEKAQGISNILNKKLQIGITSLFNNRLGQNSKPIFL